MILVYRALIQRFPTICALLLLAISGCEGWPPNSEVLESRFHENQHAFEDIRTRILGTEYYWAGPFRDGDTLAMALHREECVPVEGYLQCQMDSDRIDDAQWARLFGEARVFDVRQHDGVVRLEPHPVLTLNRFLSRDRFDDRSIWITYANDPRPDVERAECVAELKDIDCASCSIPLGENWFIEYWWTPKDLVPEALDSYVSGDMPADEYDQIYDAAYEKCLQEGFEAIRLIPESLEQT